MPSEDQLESPEFRQHIRTLLYQYSKTHLTTDFVTFTEDLVSELLQDLSPIPLTDPYSFVVPVDPFQTFSQIHSLSSLPPYDEIVPTTKEAIACIKSLTGSKPGPPMTARLQWTNSTYEPLPEPIYPALTRQSRKNTPKLGKKTNQAHGDTFRTLTEIHGLVAATIDPIPDDKLDVDDILKVKHQIDPQEIGAVKFVLKSTADALRKQDSYKNRYLEPSFLCKIDYHTYEPTEEEFLPIFPRRRAYPAPEADKNSESARALKSYVDILPMIGKTVEVEDLDGSLSRQHLVLVDGWEAIQSSPLSSPSSKNTDSEDQHDQLFFESSPNTDPPLVEEITKSRLDILIPRSRQIGGKSGITPHILAGKTLRFFSLIFQVFSLLAASDRMQTFLYPLLSKGTTDSCPIDKKEEYQPSSMTLSLLGQTGSELDTGDTRSTAVWPGDQDSDLNHELEKVYVGHGLDDVILKETLDDKQDMLMEVPSLPEPNIHPPSDFYVPKYFAEFLAPAPMKKEAGLNQNPLKPEVHHQFLKKVKGKQSLQLALSWVTFTVDARLPSVFELVGVNELFIPSSVTNEAENILKLIGTVKEHDLQPWSESTLYSPPETLEEFHVLLTRQERIRLAKMEGRSEEKTLDHSDDNSNVEKVSSTNDIPRPQEAVGMNVEVPLGQSSSPSVPQEDISSTILDYSYHTDHLEKRGLPDEISANDDKLDQDRPAKRSRLDIYSEPDFHHSTPDSLNDPAAVYYDSGYHSPGYFCEENKENYPPLSPSWPIQEQEQTFDELWEDGIEYNQPPMLQVPTPAESFEVLSLGSSYPYDIQPRINESQFPARSNSPKVEGDQRLNVSTINPRTLIESNNSSTTSTISESASVLPLQCVPEIASHSLGISAFAALRARKISNPKSSDPHRAPQTHQPSAVSPPSERHHGVPQDLLDQNTMVLSGLVTEQKSIHRYMASLDFIQKRGLVRALQSKECAVEVVERQTLGGVDLIIDPYCAVIFLSLFTLPARCDVYVQRVAEQSWKYSHLLVVFEAYPVSLATRSNPARNSSETALNVYTPPVIKAIKKFRRDISIADACGTKCSETKISYAFADSVRDAALVTRVFGSQAEERDVTSGVIWGDRSWLSVDFVEEEERLLAGVKGMNPFSSAIVLCQISLEDFVELLPQERLERFCGLLSEDVINQCNADMESRLQALQISSDANALSNAEMTSS